jgi:heptosyltransferase-2
LLVSAVLQTSFLGDMILTTPLIERLAAEGPVHVVATPANAGVLANHPAVASVLVFDKRGADRGLHGLRRMAQRLRAVNAERALLAQGSSRTAVLAWMAGIPVRITFDTSGGRLFATRRVPYRRDLHHAARLWQLGNAPGRDDLPPPLRPSLHPGPADHAAVQTLLDRARVSAQERLIALAPGSVWATKRWPHYAALASELVRSMGQTGERMVVLGAAGDAPLAAAITEAVSSAGGAPVVDATGQLSLLGSAALLARCEVLVTNDSAPLHLASAMNTPTVALFGPTVPAFGFGPLAERQTVVEHTGLECRPCHAHGPPSCPLGHFRCMQDLSALTVRQTVRQFTPLAQRA